MQTRWINKMKTIGLLLLVFLFPALILIAEESRGRWSQEPDGFHNVKFGTSEKDAKKELEIPGAWSGKMFGRPMGSQWICDGKKTGQRICSTSFVKIGDITSTASFMFKNDEFTGVMLIFDSKEYATLRAAFVTKYGEPTNQRVSEVKNLMGAKNDNEVLTWDGSNVYAEISQYGTSMTEGSAIIALRSAMEEIRALEKEKIKKTANDM